MTLGKSEVLPLSQWLVWPALVTLAVSLLRLAGELMGWSETLFGRAAGGGGSEGGAPSLIGIVWLVPIFGLYFGAKLMRHELGPRSVGKAAIIYLGLLLGSLGIFALTFDLGLGLIAAISVALTLVSILVSIQAWPDLSKLLVGYGAAARIPVAIIMLAAILGDWGTHYDVAPPGLPMTDVSPLYKWVSIGLIPQLTAWIIFTLTVGGLFGCLAATLSNRRRR